MAECRSVLGLPLTFTTCQHLPKATPVVTERSGFAVQRGVKEHAEEEDNPDPARIPKYPGVRSFLCLLWTLELHRKAGKCQINELDLH